MGMKVNGTSGLTFPDTTTLASAGQASVRAWVNFNGTGTVAIRASYNVSSITDNATGDYTVNFTTAMPDANYSFQAGVLGIGGAGQPHFGSPWTTATASSARMTAFDPSFTQRDAENCYMAVFR
jgi:predicted flavoprotein YhiN